MTSEYDVLDVKIVNLEKSIAEIKVDLKEQKENHIANMLILRENLTRLTSLMEKHDEHLRRQDQKLENQDRKLSLISKEVNGLRHTFDSKPDDNDPTDTTWYQKMIENKEKFLMYLLLILLALAFGIKIESMMELWGR